MEASFQLGAPPMMVRSGKWHFLGVPGAVDAQGRALGVAAAGLIPFISTADPNKVQLLLQVEDKKVNGGWVPALAMLGGKVSAGDAHWTGTALRETEEELGQAVFHHVQQLFADIAAIDPPQLPARSGATCTFVPDSKYQVLFLPVAPSEAQGLLQLPRSYFQEFQGLTSNDLNPGDWSRAARMLVWVEVQRDGPGQVWRFNPTDLSHLADGPAYAANGEYAAQFAQPWALPVKFELGGALERWAGP